VKGDKGLSTQRGNWKSIDFSAERVHFNFEISTLFIFAQTTQNVYQLQSNRKWKLWGLACIRMQRQWKWKRSQDFICLIAIPPAFWPLKFSPQTLELHFKLVVLNTIVCPLEIARWQLRKDSKSIFCRKVNSGKKAPKPITTNSDQV